MTRPVGEDRWLLEFIDEPAPAPGRHAARREAFARARRPVAVAMRLLAAWLLGRPPVRGGADAESPRALPPVSPRRPAGLRDAGERAALRALLDFADTEHGDLDRERH